jgi:hypothetical protein
VFTAIPNNSGEDKVDLGVMPHHEIVALNDENGVYPPDNITITLEGRDGKLDCTLFSLSGSYIIQSPMRAPIMMANAHRLINPQNLQADWAWAPWFDFEYIVPFAWDNLQLYSVGGYIEVRKVDFLSSGWNITGHWYGSCEPGRSEFVYGPGTPEYCDDPLIADTPDATGYDDPPQLIPKTIVPEDGILSFLYVIFVSGPDWHLDLSAKSKEIYGINFTIITAEAMITLAENKKMVVRFLDGWDEVENNPKIIFEAPSVGDIEFRDANNQITTPPSSVRIEKNTFTGGGAGPGSEKDSGLGTGAIVVIVLGAVAAVAIGAFCVWYFVVRPPKSPVGPDMGSAQSPPPGQ